MWWCNFSFQTWLHEDRQAVVRVKWNNVCSGLWPQCVTIGSQVPLLGGRREGGGEREQSRERMLKEAHSCKLVIKMIMWLLWCRICFKLVETEAGCNRLECQPG